MDAKGGEHLIIFVWIRECGGGGGVKYYLRGLELISLATVKKYDFKQVHGVFLKFRIVPSE